MTPEQRSEVEVRAEKAIRRGELSEALGLLQSLADAFPSEGALRERLDHLRASVLPEELRGARRPASGPPGTGAAVEVDHAAEGERRLQQGDALGAAAAYRQAVREKPHNDLYRERLVELVELVRRGEGMPNPPTPPVEGAPSATLARLAREGQSATAGPSRPPSDAGSEAHDPRDPVSLLELLLVRIAERRRSLAPS